MRPDPHPGPTLAAAVLGSTGYTGLELVRLLLQHPNVHIKALGAQSQAGLEASEAFPGFAGQALPKLQAIGEIDFSAIDVVFCCLPHAATIPVVADLPAHCVVIDLSADFRLKDIASYEEWYATPHTAPDLLKQAAYGLPEWQADNIRKARLIANPGCYPTASTLPLIPLLENKLIGTEGLIIDAKSGVSGAGRKANTALLAGEVQEGFKAYGIGHHRHTPEIEQTLSQAAGETVTVSFTPHLVPMNRGILSTIYAPLTNGTDLQDVQHTLERAYDKTPWVQVRPFASEVNTLHVRGSNLCHISVHKSRQSGQVILTSAIDNLGKGASGQAVQNMNLRFGFSELAGLPLSPLYP